MSAIAGFGAASASKEPRASRGRQPEIRPGCAGPRPGSQPALAEAHWRRASVPKPAAPRRCGASGRARVRRDARACRASLPSARAWPGNVLQLARHGIAMDGRPGRRAGPAAHTSGPRLPETGPRARRFGRASLGCKHASLFGSLSRVTGCC